MNIFKRCVLLMVMMLLIVSQVWAGPIQEIDLKYNHETQKLIVAIEFLVRDQQKDFIRKLIVYKDGKEVVEETYSLQTEEQGKFLTEFGIAAQTNDELSVKAFFSEGGTKIASLIVPPPPEQDSDQTAADVAPIDESISTQVGY